MNFSQIQNNLNEINQMLDKREKEVTYSQSQPSVYTIQDDAVYTNGTVFQRPGRSNLQCRDKHYLLLAAIGGNFPDVEIMIESTGTSETGEYATNNRVPTDSRRSRSFSNIISPSGRPVWNVPADLWLLHISVVY